MGSPDVISLDEVWHRHEQGAYQDTPTLTVEQVRGLLGRDSTETVYRLLREGVIPAYKLGGSWIIYRDMLRDYMEAERAEREARHRESPPE